MDTSANSVLEPTGTGKGQGSLRARAFHATSAARFRGGVLGSSSAAFSLIEIALAVGIMGFAFVAILGLVPVALTTFRDTKATSISSQISEQIIAQAQVAPFSALTQSGSNPTVVSLSSQGVSYVALCLPAPPEPSGSAHPYIRYFNDQGVEVLSTDSTGIYQVNSRVLVGPPFVQTATSGGIGNADVATLTVQVAYNPGKLTLDMSGTDLWAGTANGGTTPVTIVPFQTNVARNF